MIIIIYIALGITVISFFLHIFSNIYMKVVLDITVNGVHDRYYFLCNNDSLCARCTLLAFRYLLVPLVEPY